MAITTDIALSEKESEVYKRFVNLSVNESPMPQGEGTIRISPFDDYFIFTIYDEIDGVNTPIDLSNVGTIYMVFISEKDEIRIPNYTNVENVDMAAGQVLFRIDGDDAKRILALSDRTFYISTKMVDPDGESDESVLYTGSFLTFTEAAKQSLTDQLEEARVQYAKEIASLQSQVNSLNADIRAKDQLIGEQITVINSLKESNKNLSDEVKILSDKLGSTTASQLLAEATSAQKEEELVKLRRLQLESTKKVAEVAATASQKQAFFEQAAQQLVQTIPGVNSVGAGPVFSGGGGRGKLSFLSGENGFTDLSGESGFNNYTL